jgi:glycosyltransferase involved in cell wall biosynthesis
MALNGKKILYVVTEDHYFCSHRLPLAMEAQEAGHTVAVATAVHNHGKTIQQAGLTLHPLQQMNRTGINPWKDAKLILELYRLYRQEKPDIVHHVAMKPALHGSIAAKLARVPKVINALTGLGYLFINDTVPIKILRHCVLQAFRILWRTPNYHLIVQNKDDHAKFSKILGPSNIHLIRGSGVNTRTFCPPAKYQHHMPPKVVMISRLLWDKGVGELIEAARILKAKGIHMELTLYGAPDPKNPASIPESVLNGWVQPGLCRWKGATQDVAKIYKDGDIAVLPSYREGLPKSLLEAAACGLPIITTDVPGCREIVQHRVNGLLVPLKNTAKLANALEVLILDAPLREQYGKAGRHMVLENFDEKIIVKETLELYGDIK